MCVSVNMYIGPATELPMLPMCTHEGIENIMDFFGATHALPMRLPMQTGRAANAAPVPHPVSLDRRLAQSIDRHCLVPAILHLFERK
jgi:hypothetical protein